MDYDDAYLDKQVDLVSCRQRIRELEEENQQLRERLEKAHQDYLDLALVATAPKNT